MRPLRLGQNVIARYQTSERYFTFLVQETDQEALVAYLFPKGSLYYAAPAVRYRLWSNHGCSELPQGDDVLQLWRPGNSEWLQLWTAPVAVLADWVLEQPDCPAVLGTTFNLVAWEDSCLR